jgi:hypothetical protein
MAEDGKLTTRAAHVIAHARWLGRRGEPRRENLAFPGDIYATTRSFMRQ